jgi:molybdenum cofactor biosynthesis enzyme MoaA
MNYWNEVKRIRDNLRADLGIGTAQASEIVDGIMGKRGYLFRLDNDIFHAVKRDEVLRMIAELEKKGEQLELVEEYKKFYGAKEEEYINAGKLTEDELVQNASTLEQVISQLEEEAKEYIIKH